jgi:hypothetical protein
MSSHEVLTQDKLLPLWLAPEAEGGDERVWMWRTLRAQPAKNTAGAKTNTPTSADPEAKA